MLVLNEIVKTYSVGDTRVQALKGVSIRFRENEFVSVLGPSGCGKTTLLNIIGGLDQYTTGDLVINGRSTKEYKDRDWDRYRNHSVGFVFQSYNLIPHQSVLANVELALTLSGVSKSERRRRAREALERVGLGDQLKKKPNQMSGGQMQRVAIARALVNDPDILLADEPTGALDTETSVQVMEILKEIAQDRLVVMVTHNPDLAEKYSSRIVRLLDGEIIGDTNPFGEEEAAPAPQAETKSKKQAMSFFTAISLSLNNLMTKKGRTFLTAFAGSIGIIGIALILSISNGVTNYINRVQEDTLSSYPITLQAETVDLTSRMASMMSARREARNSHGRDAVYTNPVMYEMMNSLYSQETQRNNLGAFKRFLDRELDPAAAQTTLADNLSAVRCDYELDLNVFTEDPDGKVIKSDFTALWNSLFASMTGGQNAATSEAGSMINIFSSFGGSGLRIWEELLPGENGELLNPVYYEQYDVLAGSWPQSENELMLIVNERNEVSDLVLYSLGLKRTDQMYDTMIALFSGDQVDTTELESWGYDEIIGKRFSLVPASGLYQQAADGSWVDISGEELGLQSLFQTGTELRISGILRQKEDAVSGMLSGAIAYPYALKEKLIRAGEESELIRAQLDDPKTDVLSGLPFLSEDGAEPTDEEKAAAVQNYFEKITNARKAEIITAWLSVPAEETVQAAVQQQMQGMTRETVEELVKARYPEYANMLGNMDDETLFSYVARGIEEQVRETYAQQTAAQLGARTTDELAAMFDAQSFSTADYAALYDEYMPHDYSDATYEDNLKKLGYVDLEQPSSINLYAATFAAKDEISRIIEEYNAGVPEADQIHYTDYVALMMSSITTIINAISYVLIAFVAVSLVVSSIMIGIITYISVLERTKEIGILRAIGASKKDVSRVFNAETLIVGFCAGVIGIGLTLLFCLPINAIIHTLTGIGSLNAALPAAGAVILIVISVILTMIAGLIPSRLAAKKDPVVALRTE